MRVNERSVRTRCVGVRGNCFRHEGESSLEQSIKSMTILQVVSRMMIILLLFLQKQNLVYAVYQFGSVLSLPD